MHTNPPSNHNYNDFSSIVLLATVLYKYYYNNKLIAVYCVPMENKIIHWNFWNFPEIRYWHKSTESRSVNFPEECSLLVTNIIVSRVINDN